MAAKNRKRITLVGLLVVIPLMFFGLWHFGVLKFLGVTADPVISQSQISSVLTVSYTNPDETTVTEQSNAAIVDINTAGVSTYSVNIVEGQEIDVNPYIISVHVDDPSKVYRVEFYIDNNLIGVSTLPDISGLFSYPWNTAQYHSVVKVIIYDVADQPTEVIRNTTVNLPQDYQSPTPIITTLPQTGESENLIRAIFGL